MSTKSIFNTYKQLLKEKNKSVMKGNGGLDYFVTYLAMLRDHYILTTKQVTTVADYKDGKITEPELKTVSLIAAIDYYNKYKKCSNLEEKEVYWESFWELVANGIEGWEEDEHSI